MEEFIRALEIDVAPGIDETGARELKQNVSSYFGHYRSRHEFDLSSQSSPTEAESSTSDRYDHHHWAAVMADEADSFQDGHDEGAHDSWEDTMALEVCLRRAMSLYDGSSPEASASGETTPSTSEDSDTADTDDDGGHYEELDTDSTGGEITMDMLTEFVDSFLASEEEDSEEEDDELDDDVKEDRPLETKITPQRLPRYLRGLMGEANMCFARGRHEDAIKMCLEVVRQAPESPLPYQTMSMIYEELRDPSRQLQFGLIAAYLGPQDANEWSRLAQLCLEQGLVRKAASCLIRALHVDPDDLELRRSLCTLYEQLGDERRVLLSCATLARRLDEPAECLQLSRRLVDVYRKRGNLTGAARVLLNVATKFPAQISAEDIRMLLEMLGTLKMYSAALLVLHDCCGVQLLPLPPGHEEISEELLVGSLTHFDRCLVPAQLPVDIRTKLTICLIHLGARHLVTDLVGKLQRELDTENAGDLLLDVAGAFMDVGFENDALPVLRMLVRARNYGKAAAWLRYAECLQRLGRYGDATKAYERACKLAPRDAQSRLSLGQLLAAQGLRRKAIDCLATDPRQLHDTENSTPEKQQDSASMLLYRARLLWESGPREAFIEAAMALVRAHCLSVGTAEEYDSVYSNITHMGRMKVLRELHEKRGFKPGWLAMESGASVDELLACFVELCRALHDSGRMDDLRQVATEVLVSPMFNRDAKSTEELEFLSFLAHYQDCNHAEHSFPLIRSMVLKYPEQVRAWNLLGLVANQMTAQRKKAFFLRLLYKHEDSLPLKMLVGHNAFASANYKHALAEYTQLLRELGEEEPMLLLCSGISLLHMAGQKSSGTKKSSGTQKSSASKHWLATQAMAFLVRYLRARGRDCQEALFNVGRALHELGFLHMAHAMYKRALATAPAVQEMPEVFDLRREIAFNLSLLYEHSGNTELASSYICRYCVV